MIRLHVADYTCSFEKVEIGVIECYKQVNSDICGFHCLFNLTQFFHYVIHRDTSKLKSNLANGSKYLSDLLIPSLFPAASGDSTMSSINMSSHHTRIKMR